MCWIIKNKHVETRDKNDKEILHEAEAYFIPYSLFLRIFIQAESFPTEFAINFGVSVFKEKFDNII